MPLVPSVTVTLPIARLGSPGAALSLVMVPVPVAVPRTAFAGVLNVTLKASVGSTVVSPLTVTVIGRVLTPGAKVRVPLAAM